MADKNRVTFESLLAEDRLGSGVLAYENYKVAQDNSDTQFAQDFSNLAFTYIQDRAPALMPYILGFELVDREPDGTKAIGVFGFKVGDDYYYAPAFFMNNQVKGVDLLLSKKTNSFVPLTDDWIGFIVNRKENKLGQEAEVDQSGVREDFESPDFEFLRRPTVGPLGGPMTYKAGSAKDDGKPWTFGRAFAVMRELTEKAIQKDAEYADALASSVEMLSDDWRPDPGKFASSGEGRLHEYFRKYGGPDAARTLMGGMSANVKMASAFVGFYGTDYASVFPTRYGRDCLAVKKAQEKAEVDKPRVLFTDRPDHATEEEARDVVEDGFTVVDKRDDESVSKVYETDYEDEFHNPDVPGEYDVLCVGGKTHKADVLDVDRISGYGASGGTLVVFKDNGQVVQCTRHSVVVHGDRTGSPKDVYESAKPLGDIKPGSRYVFVGPTGSCVGVVSVNSVSKEEGSRPVLRGYMDCYIGRYDRGDEALYSSDFGSGGWGGTWSPSYYDTFELADFTGSPAVHGKTMAIPKNWRAVEVDQPPDYDVPVRSDSSDSSDSSDDSDKVPKEKPRHVLGDMATVSAELRKAGAAELNVRSDDGIDFYYSFDGMPYTSPMGYKEAAVALVTRVGLGYRDAKSMLKTAASGAHVRKLVKIGQMSPMVGVSMGSPVQQTPGADPYTGMPVYGMPFEDQVSGQFTGVPYANPENYQGENIGGEAALESGAAPGGQGNEPDVPAFDQGAAQLAQDAAASGQKEVFDLAAIGGLAKVYDTGDVVDTYLPELMQAIDRMGRILFLYYWRHDDFVERYGTDKVVEMEDTLRSTFKSLGSLTLDLRKKAVGQGDGSVGSL